jgi:hypothetical protein
MSLQSGTPTSGDLTHHTTFHLYPFHLVICGTSLHLSWSALPALLPAGLLAALPSPCLSLSSSSHLALTSQLALLPPISHIPPLHTHPSLHAACTMC